MRIPFLSLARTSPTRGLSVPVLPRSSVPDKVAGELCSKRHRHWARRHALSRMAVTCEISVVQDDAEEGAADLRPPSYSMSPSFPESLHEEVPATGIHRIQSGLKV